MRHLVICQRQKAPNFSAFHWSPHGCLITIGQHFVTTRVVHIPKRTETSLITESDQSRANHQLLQLIWTRLCGPCIAAKAGYYKTFIVEYLSVDRFDCAIAIYRGSYTSGHFIRILYKMTTSVRFCLSYDPLKWDSIAFKMNIISTRKRIVDTDVVIVLSVLIGP